MSQSDFVRYLSGRLCVSVLPLRPSVHSSMKLASALSLWSQCSNLNLRVELKLVSSFLSRSNSWGLISLSPPRIQISTLLPDRQGHKCSPNAAAPRSSQTSAAINNLHVLHEKEDIVALPNSKWRDYVENHPELYSPPPVCWVPVCSRQSCCFHGLWYIFMISRNNYSGIIFISE